LENEKQARHEAEAHFQKALNAVKRMLFEVGDGRMAAIPQTKATRQRLLDEALAFYTDLIASNPHHSQVYVERGQLYESMGKAEPARDDYQKAIECDPDNADAFAALGWLFAGDLGYQLQGNRDEIVLPLLRRALELQPTNPRAYLLFAWHYAMTGRPKEAAAAYRKAAELAPPGSAEEYYYLGEAAVQDGDHRVARENFEKCLSMDPLKPEAHHGLGRVQGTLVGGYDDMSSPFAMAHRGLGRLHGTLGENDQAVAAFTKALKCPQMTSYLLTDLHCDRGRLYARQKNYAAALSDYNRAIEVQPFQSYIYAERGSIHLSLKQYEQALADFAKAVELRPDAAYLYKLRGLAHFRLQHYEQALADFAKALELRPDDLSSLTRIPPEDVASCPDEMFRTGMRALHDKAIENFKSKPVQLNTASAHNGVAWVLSTWPDPQLRDPGQAVAHAKKAVEMEPGNGNFWNTLGVAQYRNGDWKAAVEALMKSIQLRKGGDSFDFFFLAMAHCQLGEKDKARAWYERAVAWMDKNKPQDEELKRFRVEATALLCLAKAAQTQNKKD
jgi:tetratricopeptide (TPR) repeat protein